jgi:hypothetical protein
MRARVIIAAVLLILIGFGISQFISYHGLTQGTIGANNTPSTTSYVSSSFTTVNSYDFTTGPVYTTHSSSSTQITSSSGSNTPCGQTSPISVVALFEIYGNNVASGDAQYTGKTICVVAASGAVTSDSSGNYVSYCPNTLYADNFCSAIGPAQVELEWRSQSAASQVPTDDTSFTAKCTVSGYDDTTYLYSVLTLSNCALVS